MAGTFNQSLQCTQDVFVDFQAPSPPVSERFNYLSVTLLTRDSSLIILGRSLNTTVVPCLITCMAWCRRLLGAFQLRTPMRNNDREVSFIFVRSTSWSHSAPRIIWAHNRSSKYRFGKTSFHQRWCAAAASSPALRTLWKVSWVIYNFSSVFPSKRNEERGYLKHHWIMSPSRRWGILFVAEMSNVAEEPTRGYRNSLGARGQLPSGSMLSTWRVLKQFTQLLPSG